MPTARLFEEAAIDYCLDRSARGVWAVRLDQITSLECVVTVRLGSHHLGDPGGVAVLHVSYAPDRQHFTCRPMEPTEIPEIWRESPSANAFA